MVIVNVKGGELGAKQLPGARARSPSAYRQLAVAQIVGKELVAADRRKRVDLDRHIVDVRVGAALVVGRWIAIADPVNFDDVFWPTGAEQASALASVPVATQLRNRQTPKQWKAKCMEILFEFKLWSIDEGRSRQLRQENGDVA